MQENYLASKIIGLGTQVHTILGPGLLESVYKECLFHKIQKEGILVQKEKALTVKFEEFHFESGYKIDLLVENKLLLEIKSLESVHPIHFVQTLTYLRLGDFKLGLLINFNVLRLKDGIKRVVNNL